MKIVVYDLDDTLYDTSLIKNRELIRYDRELNELLTLNHPSYIYSNATQAHVLDIMERKSFFGLIKKIYARRKDDIFMKPNNTGFRSVEEDILYSENLSLFDPYEIYFFDDSETNILLNVSKLALQKGVKTLKKDLDLFLISHGSDNKYPLNVLHEIDFLITDDFMSLSLSIECLSYNLFQLTL